MVVLWLLCQPKSFGSWLWDFGLGLDNSQLVLSKLKFYQIKDILATFGLKKGTFFIHQTRNRGEILAFWVWDMQLKTSHLKGWPRTGIREFYFLFVRHAGQARGREEQAILSVISRPHHYPGPCGCLSLVWHKLVWIVIFLPSPRNGFPFLFPFTLPFPFPFPLLGAWQYRYNVKG